MSTRRESILGSRALLSAALTRISSKILYSPGATATNARTMRSPSCTQSCMCDTALQRRLIMSHDLLTCCWHVWSMLKAVERACNRLVGAQEARPSGRKGSGQTWTPSKFNWTGVRMNYV